MSHLPIWYLGEISENKIDIANQELKQIETKEATMGPNGENFNQTGRDTKIGFADYNYWFGLEMFEFATFANKHCEWNFEIDNHEALQYAEYGSKQHYHWHTDTFPLSGKIYDRKVTVVCLMNNPVEFEGGEFQVRLYEEYTAPLKKGSVIAFPSFLEHRVTPVISGTRYSATMWLNGPRFK